MSLAINDFKSKLTGGGARGNLYSCVLTSPSVTSGIPQELASFMCKAASLPGSMVGQIDVPFRGKQLKLAGDRTFENWNCTMINDSKFEVRDSIERWLNSIQSHEDGTGESSDPADYQAEITINQLNRNNEVVKTYVLHGAFPINVAQIDVSYDTTDELEEFEVEFAYQYWTSNTTT